MKKIKFRGKDRDGKWHFGDLRHYWDGAVGIREVEDKYGFVVQPITVGQFTGVYDINGKEIYEGDILEYLDEAYHIVVLATWENDDRIGFTFKVIDSSDDFYSYDDFDIEDFKIIGNEFDNPELLEGGAKVD